MEQTAIAPYAGINEIVGYRNQAIGLYTEAMEKLREANVARQKACPSQTVGNAIHRDQKNIDDFRKKTDKSIWRHILMLSRMETLMDAKARREFNDQPGKDPPEVTVETARATIESLLEDRDLIFKRGMANAFSSLDRRFKTHDGFKIGSKIIVTYMVSAYGSTNYNKEAVLRDIERTFYTLDGKETPEEALDTLPRHLRISPA